MSDPTPPLRPAPPGFPAALAALLESALARCPTWVDATIAPDGSLTVDSDGGGWSEGELAALAARRAPPRAADARLAALAARAPVAIESRCSGSFVTHAVDAGGGLVRLAAPPGRAAPGARATVVAAKGAPSGVEEARCADCAADGKARPAGGR